MTRVPYEALSAAHIAAIRRWLLQHEIDPNLTPTDVDAIVPYFNPILKQRMWMIKQLRLGPDGRPYLAKGSGDELAWEWTYVPGRSECPWPEL